MTSTRCPLSLSSMLFIGVALMCLPAVQGQQTSDVSVQADPFAFFKQAEGEWTGRPTATAIGPVSRNLNLTIMKPNTSTSYGAPVEEGTWLLKHWMLDFFEVTGNWQIFWVVNDMDSVTRTSPSGNMTFCFSLPSWTKPLSPVNGQFFFMRESLTQDSVTWKFNSTVSIGASASPFTGVWHLKLHDNGTTLHSHMTMSGAAHVEAYLTRRNDTTGTSSSASQDEVVVDDAGGFQKDPSSGQLPYICGPPVPPVLDESSTLFPPASISGEDVEKKVKKSVCPLGYSSGPIPTFVQDKLDAEQVAAALLVKEEEEEKERTANMGYENCFVLNTEMRLKVAWNWSTSTRSMEVQYSSKKLPGSSGSTAYAAIGLYPEWPYMNGMDVILGYVDPASGKGCVQNLFAAAVFGQPTPNPTQVLNDTSAWLSDSGETVNVKFTRPWRTGHHDVNDYHKVRPTLGYELAFAWGTMYNFDDNKPGVGSSNTDVCSMSPGYHGQLYRGVMAINWKWPGGMPEFKKCKYFK